MPLRSFILHNLWLKIFSLFFATLIWYAIQSSQSGYKFPQTLFPSRLPTLELVCPITVMTTPGDHSALTVEPRRVVVKVRGEDATLRQLTPESIQAYVRLPDAPNLSRMLRVEVIVPREVTFKEVVPDQVSVQTSTSTDK